MSEDARALGQRLKAERERRGFSTQKIANGMHLDEWVIDALEAGDYQRIGPEVYAKGHLRKYTSLLGISAAPPAAHSSPPPPSPVDPSAAKPDTSKERHTPWPRIGTVAAVAILAGGVFWWRESHRGGIEPPPGVQTPPQVSASNDAPAEDATTVADARAELADEQVTPSPAPGTPTASAGPSAAVLTPGVGRARLRLSFSADSWVDIRDYSGKRIFEGNGRANSVKTVAGVAPFRVYLKSASGVQLQLNDRAVAIGRQFISGDEARFEAGADGVLRREPPSAPGNGPQTAAVSPHG